MILEWDDAKHERNLRERGFGFDVAASIFLGETVEVEEEFELYGEVRVQAIGSDLDGRILFVVYTDVEDDVRRIISARKATAKEVKAWLARL